MNATVTRADVKKVLSKQLEKKGIDAGQAKILADLYGESEHADQWLGENVMDTDIAETAASCSNGLAPGGDQPL
ncbi:MAG: hypothetical protein AAF636_25175 [Pseudomonadota bacterium]